MLNQKSGLGNFLTNTGEFLFDPVSGLFNQYAAYDLSREQIKANSRLDSRAGSTGGTDGVANQAAKIAANINPSTVIVGSISVILLVAITVKLVKG